MKLITSICFNSSDSNHESSCIYFLLSLVIVVIIIGLIAFLARKYYKSDKINLAKYLSLSILVVIFIYTLLQGHCIFSDEFYPHIVSGLGFLILTLGGVDYLRELFKRREEEMRKEVDIDAKKEETDFRAVIKAMLNPLYSFRTVKGISLESKQDEKRVIEILEYLLNMNVVEKRKNRNGVDVWRIISK